MLHLDIKYSLEKDAETYVNFVHQFKAFEHGRINPQKEFLERLDPELQSIITKAKDEKSAYREVLDYLTKKYNENPQLIKNSINTLEGRWEAAGSQIIYSLEFLYQKPFPFENVTLYLTTNNVCPYSYEEKYFFANYKYASEQMDVAKHELNHFMFYYYYDSLRNKLDLEKYELLKESLTLFSSPNQTGKPNEGPIREFFTSKIWGNLNEAILAGCEFLLKN
jgi:hypothetical protein